MPLTGFNPSTLGALISGAGVLMADVVTDQATLARSTMLLGVSRGGLTFDPGAEVTTPDIDGLPDGAEGLDRVTAWKPTISGTVLQASKSEMSLYFHGQPYIAVNGIQTLTPVQLNVFLTPGAYLRNVRMIVQRGTGKLVSVLFPSGIVTPPTLKTADKSEGEFPINIAARRILTGNILQDYNAPPFLIEERDALPTTGPVSA